MGINNIHILINEPVHPTQAQKLREYTEAKRILEHRAGRHPYGSMRRDCPLCVAGK